MDASRTMKLHLLQERIERDEYEVDPHKVADAILERLISRTVSEATVHRDSGSR